MKLCMIGKRGHAFYVFQSIREIPGIELPCVSSGCCDDPEPLLKMARDNGFQPEFRADWKAMLDEILQKISENKYSNPEVEQKLLLLSDKLSRTKGKKVYSGANARKVQDVLKKYTRIRSQEDIREFFRNVKSESYFES